MHDPTKRVCANCEHCRGARDGLECWLYPPAVVGAAMGVPSPIPGGAPQINWLINSVHPPVKPDWTCGQFSPKAAIVN